MHLNINLGGVQRPQFHGPGRFGGGCQMGNMLRMMMQMMQQMMQLMMGQAGGRCAMSRPNFGGGCFGGQPHFGGGHCGNPVGNFLGAHQAPPTGHWQQAGCCGGQLAGRLPGPLQRHAGAFEHYGKKYGVDPKFLAAISMLETGKGTSKAFRYKNNAMGVSNRSGPIAFGSVDQSIERMARVLAKKDGPYAGKRTIGQIAGVYCPVGAGNDVNGTNHHWPRMVSKFYTQLGGNPSVAVKA